MEQSVFVETFGDSPAIRVLDFFLTFNEFDYSTKQVAREIEAGWTTADKVIKDLLRKKILKQTREIGKAEMYALDKENPLVGVLLKIDLELTKVAADQELERQGVKVKA